MQKKLAMMVAAVLFPIMAWCSPVEVANVALEGEIQGENVVFTLRLDAAVSQEGAVLTLVTGDTGYLDSTLPRGAELLREDDRLQVRLPASSGWFSKGRHSLVLRFAARPAKDGEWRQTTFAIPEAGVRRVAVLCDRNDLDVSFPGALDVARLQVPAEGGSTNALTRVEGFLGIADRFVMRWKPEVRRLEADLVATCEASTIVTASVGALRLDTVFTYRVIQGALIDLSFRLPDMNITQVHGEDIQDWRIDRDQNLLQVTLSRPQTEPYRLRVEGEMALPVFPCTFTLPALTPERVLRTSGFLMIGTDSAIRFQVGKTAGLTQIDTGAFPAVAQGAAPRTQPSRSVYSYQFSGMPYGLDLKADEIVTSFSGDSRLTLSLADRMLSLHASVELDVRDAPLRELWIDIGTNAAWTVTGVSGRDVSSADTDTRVKDGRRQVYVPFSKAVLGTALVEIQMERALAGDATVFEAPEFRLQGARAERGYLVAAAEKGLRLKPQAVEGLREVHTGSAPMQVADAQQAFRFREPGWRVSFAVERTDAAVHSEVFHLVSLSEGVLYCSAAITYHVSVAPLQAFRLRVPPEIERVEIAGADIEGWTREGDVCTVRLQSRILGDYTLLVTYDRAYAGENAEMAVAGIETLETESEVGYVVIASSASLSVTEAQPLPASMFAIDRAEIPPEYAALVSDPVLAAFKYTHAPHPAMVRVHRYPSEPLLGQIADYVELDTQLTRDGESVTTVNYYLKNASRQHLRIRLPEAAALWSVRMVDEQGQKQDALSQRDGDVILVPVGRLRDPNTALQVEVVYALTHGEPGFWRSGVGRLTLAGPLMPDTHAAFVRWRLTAPAGFSIAGVGGAETTLTDQGRGGLPAVAGKAVALVRALLGRGRSPLAVLRQGWGGGETAEIVRAVELATSQPPQLALQVVPAWMGVSSNARGLLGCLLAGVILLACGLRRRGIGWAALGMTILMAGLSQAALGRSVLAVALLLLLVCLFVFGGGWRPFWRLLAWGGRVIAAGFRYLISLLRNRRMAAKRKAESCEPTADAPDDDASDPFAPLGPLGTGEPATQGRIAMPLLFLLCLAGLTACGLPVVADQVAVVNSAPVVADQVAVVNSAPVIADEVAAVSSAPVMDDVRLEIDGPATGVGIEGSAEIRTTLAFRTDEPVSMIIAPAGHVLKGYRFDPETMALVTTAEGYRLDITRPGTHEVTFTVQSPVVENQGFRRLELMLPQSLRNRVILRIPETGLDVQCEEAVLLDLREKGETTEAEAVFGAAQRIAFAWRPRVRRTQLEKTVFYSEVNAFAALYAGVVDVSHQIQCRIAQGEVREMKIRVPEGMTVTAVETAGVATWSFDPVSRMLETIFERPVTGELTLHVRTQVACEGLPYEASLGALEVIGAARQRGSLALAAPDTVQIRVDRADGLTPINIEDFAASAMALAAVRKEGGSVALPALRRAFRYHQAAEAIARITAEPVMPELRVEESGALTVADERIALATRLQLDVAKAAVFSVAFEMPAGFEIESLTGSDVSHWDDAGTATNAAVAGEEAWNRVVVHFNRPVLGKTEINLVMARIGTGGFESQMRVPRVKVTGARTHRGRLTLAGERGIRMMVDHQVGVDMKKASEAGIRQAGVLVFDIHRPDWSIVLRADKLDPVVKPQVLQVVELADGLMRIKAYVRYRIENAGVKTFLLQSPDPEATLTVNGVGIARVQAIDREKGIWQVDLHNKVDNAYQLLATFQHRWQRTGQRAEVHPLMTLGTEAARGFLVVTGAGRVQVDDADRPDALRVMDPRNIPAEFGAGDLSSAVKCYEVLDPAFVLPLSVVRHDAADVLPAGIEQTRITSVLATDGRQLMRVVLRMNAGRLRLLKVKLPEMADPVWTALVNGQDAPVSRDGELYCIPLDVEDGAHGIDVEFMYAGAPVSSDWRGRRHYEAPRLEGLPLRDIEWVMYAPDGVRYAGFGGSMELADAGAQAYRFDARRYLEGNRARREETLEEAGRLLDQGAELQRAGKQKEARDVLRTAMNYSQGEADLNEDARVQFRNLQMQQVKVGLYNRRNSLRNAQNISLAPDAAVQVANMEDGQFTTEQFAKIEQSLSVRDNSALDLVADRMVGQQDAAKAAVSAIRVAMPEHGRALRFYRKLLVDPEAGLSVEFRVVRGSVASVASRLWPPVVLFAAFLLLLRQSRLYRARV